MAEIRLENLGKSFGDTAVIRHVSLTIADGEFCVFVGPSGCGKSTLLRLIAGLETPESGSIHIDGEDITALEPYDRQLSMVFQSYALYPHMSVRGNIEFALRTARLPEAVIDAKVSEASRMLRLDDYLSRKPAELSGGQRQRVAIGRAVVREPRAFLFDEPLSNLDAALRADTRMEIATLHRTLGATMVYVTHDQVEAMTLADRIVVINRGAIEQIGTPRELYRAPATTFVATFLGNPSMNLLPLDVLDADGVRPFVDITQSSSRVATLGVRPEDLQLCAPGRGQLDARVAACEFHGSVLSVILATDGGVRLCALVSPDTPIRGGDSVGLTVEPRRVHAFDSEGRRIDPGEAIDLD